MSRMVGLKRIGVQPTAISRRKTGLGGRKHTYLGRPLKSSFAPKHGYTRNLCMRHVMPRRKIPHGLSSAVESNQALGRTHSAK